jgi:hypothetical protein
MSHTAETNLEALPESADSLPGTRRGRTQKEKQKNERGTVIRRERMRKGKKGEEEKECMIMEKDWSEFLTADPEVPGSIPGAPRFSEQQWVWNGVNSAS